MTKVSVCVFGAALCSAMATPGWGAPIVESDRMVVLSPTGATLFDLSVGEAAPGAAEGDLIYGDFAPPITAAIIGAASQVAILVDAPQVPLPPGETPSPVLPWDNGQHLVSDVIVFNPAGTVGSNFANIYFVSDSSPNFETLVTALSGAAGPSVVGSRFIPESGALQDVTQYFSGLAGASGSASGEAIGSLWVVSDTEIPEPATLGMLALAGAALLARRR